METVKQAIKDLANAHASQLKYKIDERVEHMKEDDKSHYLIYRVLGITEQEGDLIDVYQNKGRFLYKYAGSFLEGAATLCFQYGFPSSRKKVKVINNIGSRPKTFEIDFLVAEHEIEHDALEIKWRDATTDGDHITKEHTRIRVIQGYGYKPIRLMFYYPNRDQAIKIQQTLETLYAGVGGEYYAGDSAWAYVHERTNIDLLQVLTEIADENTRNAARLDEEVANEIRKIERAAE